ncbi:1280_t:CDS:2 [Acaulospora colombiana]|uniref:1280_t:CDS:1 n=1 Tax=Acaulospora colombiana TaxID=27376 RepID=A0ACA9LT91_9GLOM|nr:1280_t:CDS:2 [Acaulospora colombiana]
MKHLKSFLRALEEHPFELGTVYFKNVTTAFSKKSGNSIGQVETASSGYSQRGISTSPRHQLRRVWPNHPQVVMSIDSREEDARTCNNRVEAPPNLQWLRLSRITMSGLSQISTRTRLASKDVLSPHPLLCTDNPDPDTN